MSEYYEPWQPQIGQRVRVRLSPEAENYEHVQWMDGAVVIVSAYLPGSPQGRLGYPWRCFVNGFDFRFAAIELEPADYEPVDE